MSDIHEHPSGAVFAEDRTHRLYLWRRWDSNAPFVMFIGLNPSTADEIHDDPTIRRCAGFAKRWGYGGLVMCNAYTLISTDPHALNTGEPLTREAHLAMRVLRDQCAEAVAAWGALIIQVRTYENRVDRILQDLSPLTCLGITKDGHPRHPLYLPYTSVRQPYVMRQSK